MTEKEHPPEGFRDKIRVDRGSYFVTYQPADARFPIALLNLVFPENLPDWEGVRELMETEFRSWLKRYPTHLMASAFDVRDRVTGEGEERHLTGFARDSSSAVCHWGLLKDNEMPSELRDPLYLEKVYDDIPFRLKSDVQERVRREASATGRAVWLFVTLVVFVPVVIHVLSLGIGWLSWLLTVIAIIVGLSKAGKAMGWIERSKSEKEKAEKECRMRHYFYHCERNPQGFNRLISENNERDQIDETRREWEALGKEDG